MCKCNAHKTYSIFHVMIIFFCLSRFKAAANGYQGGGQDEEQIPREDVRHVDAARDGAAADEADRNQGGGQDKEQGVRHF